MAVDERSIVVVPAYRVEMSAAEEASFRRTVSVFSEKHQVSVIAPEEMALDNYTSIYPQLVVERFPADFFRSIGDYSRLLLSEEFYQRFAAYEWMLICQLDVWVFRDELNYWCQQNFDYIGAPIPSCWDPCRDDENLDLVGNGGFSLRRISAFLRVLQAGDVPMYSREMLWSFCRQHWRKKSFGLIVPLLRLAGIGNKRRDCLELLRRQGACEDMVFRMIEHSGYLPNFVFPEIRKAAEFALDGSCLRKYFDLTDRKIPFALHAWKKAEGEFLMKLWESNQK